MFLIGPSWLGAQGPSWPAHLCGDAVRAGPWGSEGLSEQQDPGRVPGGTGESSLGRNDLHLETRPSSFNNI